MTRSTTITRRDQSKAEEIANSISHGIGLLASCIGTPFLILQAIQLGTTQFIVGSAVFCTTLLILYLTSTLYHILPPGRAKQTFQLIEHSAIFLLIAGTYTPLALGVLNGVWGWTIFGLVWGLALVGIILKAYYKLSRPILFTSLYLLMGWVIVFAAEPLISRVPLEGLLWLLAGGLSYSVGVIFFSTDSQLKFGHFIWHLFVVTGSASHYFAILWYAA